MGEAKKNPQQKPGVDKLIRKEPPGTKHSFAMRLTRAIHLLPLSGILFVLFDRINIFPRLKL